MALRMAQVPLHVDLSPDSTRQGGAAHPKIAIATAARSARSPRARGVEPEQQGEEPELPRASREAAARPSFAPVPLYGPATIDAGPSLDAGTDAQSEAATDAQTATDAPAVMDGPATIDGH